MKINARIFLILTVFYIIDTAGYVIWSFGSNGKLEVIGTAAIAMLVFLSGFIAFYLYRTDKAQGSVPEDQFEAKIEDGDAEIGFFAPWSWWPFLLGLFGAMAFASLAIGWWLFFIAIPLALVAVIGFVFERSRGLFAH